MNADGPYSSGTPILQLDHRTVGLFMVSSSQILLRAQCHSDLNPGLWPDQCVIWKTDPYFDSEICVV